jgi:hypothetical protein
MSRYYRDLHDRELLSQAESILAELTRRHLLDVRVPCGADPDQAYLVGCEVNSTNRSDKRLSLIVDRCFERPLPVWPEKDPESLSPQDSG